MVKINSINYSVIIPHKNIPDLLERCLQSIPIREDIQVIVVDDNSDPDKVNFLEFPGLNRKNTEVYFTKEGKGAGYARNVGLTKAKGKWLIFSDADDYFNECFNDLLDKYLNIEVDLVIFQTNSIDAVTLDQIESRGKSYNKWIKKSFNYGEILEELRYKLHPPWGKFVSRKLVALYKIKFDEVYSSNDVMFSVLTGHYAEKILIDLNYLYCSTVRNGSLEYSRSLKNIEPRFFVSIRHYKFLLSKNKVRYRINIWEYLLKMIKIGDNSTKSKMLYSIKEIRLYYLICDFFKFCFNYIVFQLKKLS
ncbi:MAG: glycosyltransferase family 2 protein [Tissierellia bacterium]|nr:glycosyltransferase family 2 protein [Tissierellia bacterium]MDD4781481.1 glycosyltransferase family 2 protein [Tissierellia bacterium]